MKKVTSLGSESEDLKQVAFYIEISPFLGKAGQSHTLLLPRTPAPDKNVNVFQWRPITSELFLC